MMKIIFVSFLVILLQISASGDQSPQTAASRLEETQLLKALRIELNSRCAQGQFSGVVLIARNNKTIFETACGFANREKQISNTIHTQFNLGSMNKMFTSIAIAQLVNQGTLRYTDKVADLLADYPNREAAQKITVEHLLTHASGLSDLFTEEFMRDRLRIRQLKDYLPYFANHPLQFEPGSKRSYSNAAFVVAGLIIEKVSGQNYFDYIHQNIYKKAAMLNSFGFQDLKEKPSMAIGYTKERGKLEPNDFVLVAGSPAGGGFSTISDLMKFSVALREHKFLPRHLVEKVIGLDRPDGSTYGYGFTRQKVLSDVVVGHNGGAEGINADMDIYWKSGYVVIALANQDPRAAEEITKWVMERLKL